MPCTDNVLRVDATALFGIIQYLEYCTSDDKFKHVDRIEIDTNSI